MTHNEFMTGTDGDLSQEVLLSESLRRSRPLQLSPCARQHASVRLCLPIRVPVTCSQVQKFSAPACVGWWVGCWPVGRMLAGGSDVGRWVRCSSQNSTYFEHDDKPFCSFKHIYFLQFLFCRKSFLVMP